MHDLYDIHAHLADSRIVGEAERILADSRAHGLRGVLVNAAHLREWPLVAKLATRPEVCGALGLHPFFLDEWDDGVPTRLREALTPPKDGIYAGGGLRAVGEIGLDLWECEDRTASLARQIPALEAQLAVAAELRLPVILHNRKAWPEFFAVWRRLAAGAIPGVCHHFTGGREILREALDLGLHVSFCGPITYANARRIREAAAFAPLGRILTETDAPDLPAAPYCGLRSEPWHVAFVVAEIARVKQLPEESVAAAVAANYRRVLGLDA